MVTKYYSLNTNDYRLMTGHEREIANDIEPPKSPSPMTDICFKSFNAKTLCK